MKYVIVTLASNLVMRSVFGTDRHEAISILKTDYVDGVITRDTLIGHTAGKWNELTLYNSRPVYCVGHGCPFSY